MFINFKIERISERIYPHVQIIERWVAQIYIYIKLKDDLLDLVDLDISSKVSSMMPQLLLQRSMSHRLTARDPYVMAYGSSSLG